MSKNKYFSVIICALLVSSNIFAGPWSWIKNKVQSAWVTYKRWNIPRHRLIEHRMIELDDKKFFEEFRYDLSSDSYDMRKLRKILHISGVCLSNDSDQDGYEKYLQQGPSYMSNEYIENGFDVKLDNSISGCMRRLFHYMTTALIQLDMDALYYAQILWELENSLPKTFDNDSKGQIFVDVIKKSLPVDKQKDPFIGNFLVLWRNYSLRFRNNGGLMRAIAQYPHYSFFE